MKPVRDVHGGRLAHPMVEYPKGMYVFWLQQVGDIPVSYVIHPLLHVGTLSCMALTSNHLASQLPTQKSTSQYGEGRAYQNI